MDNKMKMIDAILMTILSLYMVISGLPFPTLIGYITSVMAFIYWVGRIKIQIDKYHNGNIIQWLKFFINKHKKNENK